MGYICETYTTAQLRTQPQQRRRFQKKRTSDTRPAASALRLPRIRGPPWTDDLQEPEANRRCRHEGYSESADAPLTHAPSLSTLRKKKSAPRHLLECPPNALYHLRLSDVLQIRWTSEDERQHETREHARASEGCGANPQSIEGHFQIARSPVTFLASYGSPVGPRLQAAGPVNSGPASASPRSARRLS